MLGFIAACGVGLTVLLFAADQLVLGSARTAAWLRLPPTVVGVVVIGFGTSAPELVASGLAAAAGKPGLAMGNIVGSNLANLTLVLGSAGLFGTVAATSSVLRREAPLSVAAVLLFAVLVRDGLGRADGLVLAAALAACLGWLVRGALRRPKDALGGDVAEFVAGDPRHRWGVELTRTLLALAGTLAGAQLLVWGAAGIAEQARLSQAVVGATVVAVGTSAPELVTAIQAARRGEADLLVGNVLGSNLFNSLAVGAVVALAGPGVAAGQAVAARLAVVLMVTVSLGAWWFLFRDRRLLRWEAAMLLVAWPVTVVLLGR
ncbi:MAG TPA: calcium/sodium antiporter [Actinomycetota bacterium]|jgi:cation:H+ antiporter|nr:calcium/sodium antiporter [Actinomycetota bacterium]